MVQEKPLVGVVVGTKEFRNWNGNDIFYGDPNIEASNITDNPKDKVLLHAMLIIGYGTDETTGANYWIMRNSWGGGWGDGGHGRIARASSQKSKRTLLKGWGDVEPI